MGQKVNYNKDKTNKLKVVIIVVLCLITFLILLKSIKDVIISLKDEQNNEAINNVGVYTTVKNYTSLEELLASYNCKVLSKQNSEDYLTVNLSFGENLYDNETSHENYFINVCKGVAEFIKYKDFRLLDENKKIDIEVKCEKPNIVELKINGDVDYYLNHDSDINSRKRSNTVTNFTIDSQELKVFNEGKWLESNVNFGKKDSTCDGYNIYFEEGIKYKIVARNIFNVIFTSNYKGKIAGGLDVNSTKEEVEKALGVPTFDYCGNIYGYKGQENYLFFNFINKEVSVYPVAEITKEEENKLKEYIEKMNETNDIKRFVTDLTGYWLDFDVYKYDSNFVDLRYTLKGIQVSISSDSLKNGIFIYNNYVGNIDIRSMDNVYVSNSDFVFEQEKNRSMDEMIARIEQGDFTEETIKEYGIDFSVRFQDFSESGFIGPKFYSRDKSHPDSELEKTLEISSYKWYGNEDKNYLFIYSVDDEGIYVYNCITRVNSKIIDLTGNIEIDLAKDEVITFTNNDEQQNINIILN